MKKREKGCCGGGKGHLNNTDDVCRPFRRSEEGQSCEKDKGKGENEKVQIFKICTKETGY